MSIPVITQLNPYIPVYVVEDTETNLNYKWPSGEGVCVAWIDYSQEHATLWKVCFDDGGEPWDVPQSHIRLQNNSSLQRGFKRKKSVSEILNDYSNSKPEIGHADDWIKWGGNKIPPVYSTVLVNVRLRNGSESKIPRLCENFRWDHCNEDNDIMEYKIVKA